MIKVAEAEAKTKAKDESNEERGVDNGEVSDGLEDLVEMAFTEILDDLECEMEGHKRGGVHHGGKGEWSIAAKCWKCGNRGDTWIICDTWADYIMNCDDPQTCKCGNVGPAWHMIDIEWLQ